MLHVDRCAQEIPSQTNHLTPILVMLNVFFPPLENKVHGSKNSEDSTQENTRGTITNEEKDTRKKKRIRNRFTQRQINYLEDVFSRQMYLTRDERALLSKILYMTELQIRNWFQNKRYQFRNKTINRPSFLRRQ